MADYSCEWCKHDEDCKYAWNSTTCEPKEMLDLYNALSKEKYEEIVSLVEYLKRKEDDSDYIQTIASQLQNNIIYNYPNEEELKYIKDLLSD